jgi:DNA polymerase-1
MPDDLQLQTPLIRQMLDAMRVPLVEKSGYEADDVIATLATAGANAGMDVFVCSSDKDCRQLLSDRIKIFNLRKREVFDAATLKEDWGVAPEQVIDYQALVGDSVDNVKGAEGVGPKTASKYLQDYGTIENLIAHIDDLKGKKKENLQAFVPNVELSRKLVTLDRHVPIEMEWENWRVREWDAPRLAEQFRTWGFRAFAEQLRVSVRSAPPPPPPKQIVQGSLFGDDEATAAARDARAEWPHEYHLVNTEEALAGFLAQLKQQTRFAIDLETTSLDPRQASIVGIAICFKPAEAWYLALRAPSGEPTLDPDETLAHLKPILENASIGKVNQNIKYDWQTFRAHDIHLNGIVGDSMLADYLLHAGTRNHNLDSLAIDHLNHRNISITELIGKGRHERRMDRIASARVAEYAGEDADVAFRLCEKLEPALVELGFKRPGAHFPPLPLGEGPGVRAEAATAESLALTPNPSPTRRGEPSVQSDCQGTSTSPEMFLYDDLEIPLIEVLALMEYTGIRLDVPFLQRMSKEMDTALAKLEAEIHEMAGYPFNINSVPKLREILFKQFKFKPLRKTDIGGESSTDQETLEQLARQDHPHVGFLRKLLEHRKIVKLKGTYVDALPALVNPNTGRVHASLNQTVAATGRLSSSDPNLQNIPIRSEMGEQIRQAFLPEHGCQLLTADYSQIELRLLAHFSGDEALQRAFEEDRDIHAMVAEQIFNVTEHHVTEAMRRAAKTVNFGVIYGISAMGLGQRLNIPVREAAHFIEAYFTKYPAVQEYQQNLLKECREQGQVKTILGRRRRIEGVRAFTSYKGRNQPEREAINMQIQGSAADLIKIAMLNIHRRLEREERRARMLLQIHDELVFEVPPAEQNAVIALVHEEMTQALADRLRVPLKVDMSIGDNWLNTSEITPPES